MMNQSTERPAELLTTREAAAILAVGRQAIRKAIRAGDLVAVQAPGTTGRRGLRILARSVSDYIAREVAAGSAA